MVQVSIAHLMCFVLVVFSVNVLVLAYLTGALSGMMDLSLGKLAKLRPERPERALPPWQQQQQRKDTSPPQTTPFPPCLSGVFWENGQHHFCKLQGADWVEHVAGGGGVGKLYAELSFSRPVQEAVLQHEHETVVLKRAVAFKGTSRDDAFDHVHLVQGNWHLANNVAAETMVQAKPVPTKFSPTDCTRLWSVQGESAFCKLKPSGKWIEVDQDSFRLKFAFDVELFDDADGQRGVGLLDTKRMVVIVLMRTYALIAHPTNANEAMQLAIDTRDIVMTGGTWREHERFAMIPPVVSGGDNATVLLMISAFHDDLCSNTLREAFATAARPERVSVSVIDQVSTTSCLETYCKDTANCRRDQVREIRVTQPHSRGVMFARFLQQTQIRDEEFCLQVDSHMVFPQAWDELAIGDWRSTGNEMAVMTTYPNRALDVGKQKYSPIRCNTVWNSHVVACGTSANNIAHKQPVPHFTAFFGAGIAFSKCHANLVVPYDPWMPFLFKGEEYNRGARLWTHGYDLYAPRVNYAYHFYDDDPRPGRFANLARDRSFFGGDPNSNLLLRQSEYRWQAVLGMKDEAKNKRNSLKTAAQQDIEYFGIGNKRSLREFELFGGVNLREHTAKDMCHLIGKMVWVPWNTTDHRILGKGCAASSPRRCCNTTMDRILANGALTARYLNQTNQEFADQVTASELADVEERTPVLSIGWEQASAVC